MTEKEKHDITKQLYEEIKKTLKSVSDYKEIFKPISPENAMRRISRMDALNNKSAGEAG